MTLIEEVADDDGEKEGRYISINVEGKMWEVEDVEGEAEYRKRDLRTGREFTVPGAQFDMYARMGFHFVVGMDVTDAQFEDIVTRLKDLEDGKRIAFAKEMAMTPPE